VNPKLEKYIAEKERNERRIEALHTRNAKLGKLIAELQNLELHGLLRGANMTYQDLTTYIQSQAGQDMSHHDEKGENAYEHTETAGGKASAEEKRS
jgi:hypothetical protein